MRNGTPSESIHAVVSYGDIYAQSGYRTRVLGELNAFERCGPLKPVLFAFDRNADELRTTDLGVPLHCYGRREVFQYYLDLRSLSRRTPITTVHAHNLYSAALALAARPAFGYKVLLDLHGRIPEEYRSLGKGNRWSYAMMQALESWVVERADHVIVVSHKLEEYLASSYGLSNDKLTVIPMCADGGAFRWDAASRTAVRRELNLEGKFVCVHSGSVFHFYDPQMIVDAFHKVTTRVSNAHLLVLTKDVDRTREFLSSQLPVATFTVTHVPHATVSSMLTAADLGFLLLRPSTNIETSSPAKFSEYLNAGLPVLISSAVGDFSEVVATTGVGAVVSREGDFDVSVVDRIDADRDGFARLATETGGTLTWNAFAAEWARAVGAVKTTPLLG